MMLGISLTIFSPVGRLLKALWSWTTANPMRLVIVALMALSGFLAISNASLRGDKVHLQKVYAGEVKAHKKTVANFKAAQETAKRNALANVERVRNEYQEINDDAQKDYYRRLASGNANLDRWKLQNSGGAASGDNSTGIAESATRTARASGTTVLLEGYYSVPERDLEVTAEAFAKLEALQAWASSVGGVETTTHD